MVSKQAIGVIGGTGLYHVDGFKKAKEVGVSTPFGRPSDRLLVGDLYGVRTVFLARHGRNHTLFPHQINFRANIYALKLLGVETLISITAVGSMKESVAPGDIVVCDQFIDLTKQRHATFLGTGLVAHAPFGMPTCPFLSRALFEAAVSERVTAHPRGTYVCIEGPHFSTKAESLLYRSWGVDVIGMTALQEAKLAREAELCFSAMALVTDYDCWHETEAHVTVEMVMKTLSENSQKANAVLSRAIPALDPARTRPITCGCQEAMKTSFITPLNKVSAKLKKQLHPLYGHYFRK